MKSTHLLVPVALAAIACQQAPTPVPVRSLERSGKIAFVCLDALGSAAPGHPIDDCSGALSVDWTDYETVPQHLFGLVTQTVRGELALIDVTGSTVFDTDPSTPGYNFQPIGAQPLDVVVTPGGTAAFVSVGEPNRAGIYALPTAWLRSRMPDVTYWPACALPGTPGAMTVMVDPPQDPGNPASARASCDGAYGQPPTETRVGLDLALETRTPGTRKIVVAVPELGEIDVVDAQDLLSRAPGSFDACKIERRIPLVTDVAGGPAVQPSPDGGAGGACATPAPIAQAFRAHPSALDASPGKLLVADDGAPVIHVLEGQGPCELEEHAPLLPSSIVDPRRVVRTSSVALSPITTDGKQFAYAVDLADGSVMAFDVGPSSSSRAPIVHDDVPHDPFEPRDRIQLGSPVRQVGFAQRDTPIIDASGIARGGVKCDPSPTATDPAATSFRTAADYTSGAAPRNLRGIFGFAVLESGQIAVIDVDDFDAPCRRPLDDATGEGCGGTSQVFIGGPTCTPLTSQELSCNVVQRHRLRAGRYFAQQDLAGHNGPSLQTTPTLYDRLGNALPTDQTDTGKTNPKLLGPAGGLPFAWVAGQSQSTQALPAAADAGCAEPPPPAITLTDAPAAADHNWVAFDFRQPRAHLEQDWSVTYRGVVPGFGGHVAHLQCVDRAKSPAECDPQTFELWDPSAVFCDRGVLPKTPERIWNQVRIADEILDDADPYWQSVADKCSPVACRTAFGASAQATDARDLDVIEAYEDHLVAVAGYRPDNCCPAGQTCPPAAKDGFVQDPTDCSRNIPIACCFPQLVSYQVRVAEPQWIVVGSASGFVHDVVADPATLACVRSCDQSGAPLRNGRAFERDPADPPPAFDASDPTLFRNAQMQFVVWSGSKPSQKDMSFGFHVTGGFSPLVVNLAAGTSVAPQSMTLVPPLGELAFPDGASQGVVFVSLSSLGVSRQFL